MSRSLINRFFFLIWPSALSFTKITIKIVIKIMINLWLKLLYPKIYKFMHACLFSKLWNFDPETSVMYALSYLFFKDLAYPQSSLPLQHNTTYAASGMTILLSDSSTGFGTWLYHLSSRSKPKLQQKCQCSTFATLSCLSSLWHFWSSSLYSAVTWPTVSSLSQQIVYRRDV